MAELRTLVERAMDRAGSPLYSFVDLARRRHRKQRNRRLGTAVLALAVAAAAIGGVVRAFRVTETPRPANPPSLPSTPDVWTRVPFPSDVGDAVLSITAGGPGLVAVGFGSDAYRTGAAVWTSADGRTWTNVHLGLGDGPIFDVTTGGPGLVAVGTTSGGWGAGSGDLAPVWTSVDGLSWSRAPSDPAFRGAWLRAVTAGGPGLVAVGSTLDGPQAWYSPAGTTWERASVPPAPPDVAHDGRQADAWMQDVAATGDRLVAVGQIGLQVGENGVRYVPAMWTSTDGVTWTEISLDEDVFPSESEVRSVAAGPGGFVAVGGIFRDVPMVWTSEDGLTWRRVSDEQDAFVSRSSGGQDAREDLYFIADSVAAGGGGYVAMGGDQWCVYNRWDCTPAEAAVWTSTDGETWVRVPTGPVFQVGRTQRVQVVGVAAWGSRFVAAGMYGGEVVAEEYVERTAIWISESRERSA